MRIAAIIVGTLMLLIAAGIGLLGTNRSIKDARDIDRIVKPMKKQLKALAGAGMKDAGKLNDLANKTGKLRAGAVFFAISALLALALMVMMFIDKGVPYVAIALVVIAVVSIVVNPHYDLGPTAPASARSLAIVAGVVAALGAGAAYGASLLKKRKLQAAAAPVPA